MAVTDLGCLAVCRVSVVSDPLVVDRQFVALEAMLGANNECIGALKSQVASSCRTGAALYCTSICVGVKRRINVLILENCSSPVQS